MTEQETGNLNPENEAEEADTSEEQTAEGQEADDSADDGELTEREKQFLARAKKAEAKLKEAKTSKGEAKTEPKKSNTDDFDYGQLSYLEIKGVKSDPEIEFVKKMMDRTGDSLKEVLNDDYVKNRLRSIREEASVKAATPSSTRRAQPSGKSSVDYWLAKGELPPNDQPQLRRDVLNARLEREKQASKFSDNPVVTSL
jgi:hypothetical protein